MAEESLPFAFDRSTLRFREYLAKGRYDRFVDARGSELASLVVNRIGSPSDNLQGEVAAEYLTKFIDAVTAAMIQQHSAYGRVRWLWYLRRFPGELFAGAFRTTLAYDSALADGVSWFFANGGMSTSPTSIAFPDDEGAFRQVCRFVGGIRLLSHLHAMYRRNGKGAVIRLEESVPFANHSPSVDRSIRLYDQRHDKSNEFTRPGLGLSSIEPDGSWLGTRSRAEDVFLIVRCAPLPIPVNGPDGRGGFIKQRVNAQFALTSTSLRGILSPLSSPPPISAPYLQVIEPYLLLLVMFPILAARIPWALASTVQLGYFFITEQVLESLCDDWLGDLAKYMREICPDLKCSTTYYAWHRALTAIEPSLWPLRAGGVLRRYDSQTTMVDVASASSAVLQHLEFDRTSSQLANLRSHAFELQVQAMIDASNWAPPEHVRGLRGVHLRRSGTRVGELDAIGAKGDTLLLISCKSVIYDRAYDKGEYRVVRNIETTVNQAVQYWTSFVSAIERQSVGDNFDLSAYSRLIAVVCTPFVVYTAADETLAFATNGLRRCVSVLELRDWLTTV